MKISHKTHFFSLSKLFTCCTDYVPNDGITLEEEEEDAKELDNYRLRINPIKPSKPVSHLCEVGTLSCPQGSSTQSQYKSCWDQGVEFWVELCCNVEGVAKDGDHQGPLHLQLLDHDAGQKHGGEDHAGTHSGIAPGAKVVDL